MKKLLIVGLCIVMMLTMGACGSADKADSTSIGAEAGVDTNDSRNTIVDMRGVSVEIPVNIERVAIIDKGFLVQTMVAMGVSDKIVASGDLIQGAEDINERDSLYLCPELLSLPQIGYPTAAVDYETLVASQPDIVILRNSEYIKDSEITAEVISKIEDDLNIPLVVVNGPGCYDDVKLDTQYEGIRLLGEVFNKQDRAEAIIELMQAPIALIQERTADIAEEDKPSVMYIGGVKGEGVSGTVWGANYGDAKFGEEVANIKNVHETHEAVRKVSAEQIITMNPDNIILCTVSVTPEVFLNDEVFSTLRNVTAVQEKNVASIGLLTWWGDFRLEVPTIMMISAASIYPQLFADINMGDWLNEYHMALYNLSEEEAQELKVAQQLEWLDKIAQ